MLRVRRARRPLLALVALVVALAVGYGVRALNGTDGGPASPGPTLSTGPSGPSGSSGPSGPSGPSGSVAGTGVALSSLPPEAAQTVRLIEAGGPFPYPDNDGVVFHNFEHLLPAQPDGYYHEYTVPTPGSPDRGARRIITGGTPPLEFWYTGDHYETFERVDVDR